MMHGQKNISITLSAEQFKQRSNYFKTTAARLTPIQKYMAQQFQFLHTRGEQAKKIII